MAGATSRVDVTAVNIWKFQARRLAVPVHDGHWRGHDPRRTVPGTTAGRPGSRCTRKHYEVSADSETALLLPGALLNRRRHRRVLGRKRPLQLLEQSLAGSCSRCSTYSQRSRICLPLLGLGLVKEGARGVATIVEKRITGLHLNCNRLWLITCRSSLER